MADFVPGRPGPAEYEGYYRRYVDQVPDADVLAVLRDQVGEVRGLLGGLAPEVALTRHPPYTWSINEVVGHLADAERVFGYRALRFARADDTPLPGFDENAYVPAGRFDAVPLAGLVAEWEAVRQSHLALFGNLPAEAWGRAGTANGARLTVRAVAWVLAGHVRHHLDIVRTRLGRG